MQQYSKNKKNILIIDEIQALQDIYISGDKILLNEFLNFCVRLTKETHLSHVVILSSNTLFINEIYTNAKLKETSKFYKIDHLPKDEIVKWLKCGYDDPHKFNNEEIELIWDYFGGAIPYIQKMLTNFCELHTHDTLQKYLDNEAKLALSDIKMSFWHLGDRDMIETFKAISKDILEYGYFKGVDFTNSIQKDVIDYFCEKEILFFEPSDTLIYPNSRIYVKAMQRMKLD